MNIKTKKLRKSCWEMRLVLDEDWVPDGKSIWIPHPHDTHVRLIDKELLAWDGVMYSKQAHDRWHWYDRNEMNRFITLFLLKYGDK